MANGLDTDACKMAITRFMARRGRPQTVTSKNGKFFVGAARELRECFKERDRVFICERLAGRQIMWSITPRGAPHFGGVWERQVRSCKKAMFAFFWKSTTNFANSDDNNVFGRANFEC